MNARAVRESFVGAVSMATLIVFASSARAQATTEALAAVSPTGSIAGSIVDVRGQRIMPGRAVVFLCDARSGLPLAADTRGPLDPKADFPLQFSNFCHAITDDSGAFTFENVPPGAYRLVAQAWAGVEGMAASMPGGERPEPSSTLILYGVAENVEVKSGEQSLASCRQQGDGVLTLLTDPEEEHNFIVLSSKPLLGEGVLGPVGWGEAFIAGALGITRAETPQLVIIGLAADAEVHVGLLNYDNAAGTGGGAFRVGGPKPARLLLYAGWSNGKDEPSPRLLKLTEALEASDIDVEPLLKLGKFSNDEYLQYIGDAWRRADESVDVPGYGAAKLIDVLAAQSYRELRMSHANRRARADAAGSP